jgi:chemotaxis protein MotB
VTDNIADDETLVNNCKPCPAGVAMWMATFADMAILLMAFFVLLIAFADMDTAGAQTVSGTEDGDFGVQNEIPIVDRPEGDSVIAKTFSPAQVEQTLIQELQEDTTDIKVPKDVVLTAFNKQEPFKSNDDVELIKRSLAKEIAEGKVRIRAGTFQAVIEIVTDDSTGTVGKGENSKFGTRVREDDLNIYAKVAALQSELELELSLREVPDSQDAKEAKILAREAAFADKYQKIRRDMAAEINKGQAEVLREGDKIIVRLAEQGSFASGRATIKTAFEPVLNKLGASLEGVTGLITVEGHTDNVPMAYNEQFRSNWDLSAARASAVVEFLLDIAPASAGNIMASGMADIKPLAPNNTSSRRARNRRIEVVIDAN